MAGCSQGNNVWMLRDFASFREAQGRLDDAATLRKHAAALSSDSMSLMYNTDTATGHGWFNVLHPESAGGSQRHVTTTTDQGHSHGHGTAGHAGTASQPPPPPPAPPAPPATSVASYEMRHVVDFFSMTFGLCGLSGTSRPVQAGRGGWSGLLYFASSIQHIDNWGFFLKFLLFPFVFLLRSTV